MIIADLDSLINRKTALTDVEKAELIKAGDQAALVAPDPVTNKKHIQDGLTPNDYVSLGTYWWENPNTDNGRPYIRRDGYVNPQGRDTDYFDRQRLDIMTSTVFDLSTAYFYTGDQSYKIAASQHLDQWFINAKTRMNPSLTYAQQIPGICNGRDIGIIDTHTLIALIDSARMINYDNIDLLKEWYAAYLEWLLTSDNGRSEARQGNNHGLWYDAQVMAFADFTGNISVIRRAAASMGVRLAEQVAEDGSLPKELARTRSYYYSLFALRAILYAQTVAKKHDCGFLNDTYKKCVDFLLPYVNKEKKWEYCQIDETPPEKAAACMWFAYKLFGQTGYLDAAKRLYDESDNGNIFKYRFPL